MDNSGAEIRCELIIIGSGMAGMAASLFAANRGIDVLQVGITGEINFASGLIDLLGVHPVETGRIRKNPWTAINELTSEIPTHPYARMAPEQIKQALDEFLDFLQNAGLPYSVGTDRNMRVITPVGTKKTTYAVPASMAGASDALATRSPCLVVDFYRLKGFSGRQIVQNLGKNWTDLRSVRIEFPDLQGELYTEKMAWALENPDTRQKLVKRIQPHIGNAKSIGMPAVLGIYRTSEVVEDMRKMLGIPVFEIPTMLPAITGMRLRDAFEQRLPRMGVRTFYQQKVTDVQVLSDDTFRFTIGKESGEQVVRSRAAVLATGRFFGKGLYAKRTGIKETVFNLPVYQPPDRTQWHHKDLLHPEGHLINQTGLETDDQFRPVDESGDVIYPGLFAAGSVLAHQDWVRQKCGSGLAIASAFGAISGYKAMQT